jgi:hypothetical protein
MSREDKIRIIAYALWEKEGYPEGKDVAHWFKANTVHLSHFVISLNKGGYLKWHEQWQNFLKGHASRITLASG